MNEPRPFIILQCVYDNPLTFRREVWHNGVLMVWISFDLLVRKSFEGFPYYKFNLGEADIGPWNGGGVVGDPEAMLEYYGRLP